MAILAIRTIEILEEIHAKGILHCNITPDKLLVSKITGRSIIYLVDFKAAKRVNYKVGKAKG